MRAIPINTTQNVRLEYEIASVGERILAAVLDYLVFFGWFALFSILNTIMNLKVTPIVLVIVMLPPFFYHLVCEIFLNGQSIGKRSLGIRVLKKDGTQPSLGDYLMRWVFRLVDCTLGWGSVAVICILINGKGQRVGDIAAGTAVVRTRRRAKLEDIQIRESVPGYTVTYPEVISLSDKDIGIVRKILKKSTRTGKLELLDPLAERVCELMAIQTKQEPYAFLTTVINDYHHLVVAAPPESL